MNKKISSFLDNVCIHINCKSVHKDIREELAEHINELQKENINGGYDEKTALDMAIAAMGSTDEIGINLNKQHKPQTEWLLLALTLLIAAFGGMIIYISSRFEGFHVVNFENYLITSAIGFVILIAVMFFDYTKLLKCSFHLYWGLVFVMIIGRFFCTDILNGNPSIALGGFSFTLEQLLQLFVIPIAGFLCKYKNGGWFEIIKLLGLAFLPFAVVMIYPSLANALIFTACFIILLTVAICKKHFKGKITKYLVTLYGIGTTFLCGVFVTMPEYARHRLFVFITGGDPMSDGWQISMAKNWIAVSQFFGKTSETVRGMQFESSMPNSASEYVLVNMIVNLGWIVAIALMIAVAIFIIRLFCTVKKAKISFGYYLSLAACITLSLKFVISILLNFNLFPTLGIGFPLVSYGGTDYAVTMVLIGIVLSVWRRNNLISYKNEKIPNVVSSKRMISFTDGKLVIDLNVWR